MPDSFERAQQAEAPAWMQDEQSLAVIGRSGVDRDAELMQGAGKMIVAVKCRFADSCPDDALDEVGDTRDIERFPGETDEAYRARLKIAFTTHRLAGTAPGIIASLEGYLSALGAAAPDVRVLEDWEGAFATTQGANYARFLVVVRDHPWYPLMLGIDWVLGESLLGGPSATIENVRAIKAQVRKWKDAHGASVLIRVVTADLSGLTDLDLLGVDWTLGTSALGFPVDSVEWVMLPLLGIDWTLGASPLAAYVMT